VLVYDCHLKSGTIVRIDSRKLGVVLELYWFGKATHPWKTEASPTLELKSEGSFEQGLIPGEDQIQVSPAAVELVEDAEAIVGLALKTLPLSW